MRAKKVLVHRHQMRANTRSYVCCYKCAQPIRPIIYEEECLSCKIKRKKEQKTYGPTKKKGAPYEQEE